MTLDMALRWPQIEPISPKIAPKRAPNGPKMTQDSVQIRQAGPKLVPRGWRRVQRDERKHRNPFGSETVRDVIRTWPAHGPPRLAKDRQNGSKKGLKFEPKSDQKTDPKISTIKRALGADVGEPEEAKTSPGCSLARFFASSLGGYKAAMESQAGHQKCALRVPKWSPENLKTHRNEPYQ